MEDKAVRSLPWAFLSNIAKKLLTLGTTVVLARLLAPDDFGVVVAGTVAVGALTAFTDLGAGGVLVVRQELSHRDKRCILGLMLVMSAVSTLVIAVAAPHIAGFFGDQRITAVLRVLLVTVALGGFSWFYENLLTRELEFRKRFRCEVAQAVVLGTTSIVLAAQGLGYWAVVVGTLAGWATYTVALLVTTPYRVRPAFDPRVLRELVRQGKGFNLEGAVSMLQSSADYLAVGRVLGSGQLGFYSMGYRVAEQGYWAVAEVVGRVSIPAFARMRQRGEDVTAAFVRTLQLVTLLCCPLGVVLSGVAAPFTQAIFGDRWLPMSAPLAVLGLWAAARPIQYTMSWYLASQDRAGLAATGSLSLLVVHVPLLFLAARSGGIVAVAWVMLGHSMASAVVYGCILRRWMGVGLRRQLSAIRSVVIAGGLSWIATRLVAGIDALGPTTALLTAAAAGLAVYGLVLMVLEPVALRDLRAKGARLRPVRSEGT